MIDLLGTGHKRIAQPDNAEYDINRTPEACLAVLNNVYNDGMLHLFIICFRFFETLDFILPNSFRYLVARRGLLPRKTGCLRR